MSGAAQHEMLVDRPGLGMGGMDAQSIAHLLIIAFIFIGNIAHVAVGQKEKIVRIEKNCKEVKQWRPWESG